MHMTLIDVKVLNVLIGTNSSKCCPICGAKPKQFLEVEYMNSQTFKPKSESLKYGVSRLHAWIRFLEFVLKISYKLGTNKWQIRDNPDKEKLKYANKAEVATLMTLIHLEEHFQI